MLAPIDYAVFGSYLVLVTGAALLIAYRGNKNSNSSTGYFLAGKSLPWWAIGASLIAANISAEQLIGMSGSGFALGIAIASYEWMSALTLLLVARFLLPVFLARNIRTMPEYLEQRYDHRTRSAMAIFWVGVYVCVNLTSVLYLGALALNTLTGVSLISGVVALAALAALYSVYGGLRAVAWTDVIQVFFLVLGGLITTWQALNLLSGDQGALQGLTNLWLAAPEKFDLILNKAHEGYTYLPGWSVVFGGLWIANISYWGLNQYIIQRALAAKSLKEAQNGLAFAGYLKLLMPVIVVLPGIAAYGLQAPIATPDGAYPWLLSTVLAPGLKGLALAALFAAIVSSLCSMANSTATLFTLDILPGIFNIRQSEKKQVTTGRAISALSLLIAALIAPQLASIPQTFQFIQNFTGLISPGIVVIFLFGIFWKKAGKNAAFSVAILSIPVSWILEAWVFPGMPFLDRMGVTAILLSLVFILVSLVEKPSENKSLVADSGALRTPAGSIFQMASLGIVVILGALYYLLQ